MADLNSASSSCDWSRLREQMPVARKWAYFDHAAVAPLPTATQQAMTTWVNEAAENGDAVWPNWARRLESLRNSAATMISASPNEIALVPNTTAGITLVAEGFPFQEGDNVVTLANEFPSNLYPWMAQSYRGVEVRRVAVEDGVVDLARLEAACDQRTRIISVSWIGYGAGWRLNPADVADIAERVGALFFLDAIQGLGVFPLDVSSIKVDFLAADGHKWMLGPEGAGLFYCRQEHLDTLRPVGIGWNSVVHRYDFKRVEMTPREAASRYEGGTYNMAGFHGLAASLELLQEFGVTPERSAVAERILNLTDYACEELQSAGAKVLTNRSPQNRSGIVVFDVPGHDPSEVRSKAFDAGIVTSCRGGGLRISPHAYNDQSDIQRLVEVLREL
ncbi:MAG: aminotransferase class V-fold PLP-dependent enzyme [Planctomycetota bacterium]